MFVCITVECAHLKHNVANIFRPSPYVALVVDGNNPLRTDTVKNTLQPKWNEKFTVLVTKQSTLHFSVIDHNSFRKDTTIGEKKVMLNELLTYYKGKIENLELSIDLINEKQSDANSKCGDLICLLSGLHLEVSRGPQQPGRPLMQANSDAPISSRSVFNGMRAKVRAQGSENAAPSSATGATPRQSIERSASLPNNTTSIPIPIRMYLKKYLLTC